MIRRTQEGIVSFCQQDVFGTRIAAYLATYGMDADGASFYVQEDAHGVTAVLSDVFSQGTLTCSEQADLEELREFVDFLPLQSLLCATDVRQRLSLPFTKSGKVMQYVGGEPTVRLDLLTPQYSAFDYKKVYALLKECGFAIGDYLPWLSDLALRVGHGTANVYTVCEEDMIISTASVLFQTPDAVCIGAVGTHPSHRRKGYADAVLQTLVHSAGNRRIELLCEEEMVSFYKKLGFQINGDFSV